MINYSIHKSVKSGFSLLELLLAIGIIGVITAFALSISQSAKSLAKTAETKKRMREISARAQDYYRGQQNLPASPTGTKEVPVGTSGFNLEQRHRLDGWGQFLYYDLTTKSITVDGIPFSSTNIAGIEVDGRKVAGVIISGGPNQKIDTANNSPYSTTGDDIIMPINLTSPAMEIALEELQVLQAKVEAFDAVFAKVNNDPSSDSQVDEDGCKAVSVLWGSCPPTNASNDPNCGTATLDTIDKTPGYYSGCSPTPVSARAFLSNLYSLANHYRVDPWLNPYIWGNGSIYGTGNPRHHKFFSSGPNGTADNSDDIIP